MIGDDPYVWIDPWREIHTWQVQAHTAYRRATDEVLNLIKGEKEGDFRAALSEHVRYVAAQMAEQYVKPHLRDNLASYKVDQRLKELTIEQLQAVARPLVVHAQATGVLDLEVKHDRENKAYLELSYTVTRPFEYHVRMSPDTWRRGGL